ncbi:MAG: C45 family autoproteolytic acyltransferase/hydrolase [Clostridia bacterium]|nr:C45 family autoproteolytic acyltransferase/hydrolase [Clostridia bacterium]
MKKTLLMVFLAILLILQSACNSDVVVIKGESNYKADGVTIVDKGNYFEVVLDFSTGLSHRQIGKALAEGILKVIPDYEALVDSYIAENLPKYEYPYMFYRVEDIKPQVNKEYIEEVEGMASVFSGGKDNVRGDNKISEDELLLFNLFPDVARIAQCSIVSVFGSRSETGENMVARNLDWYGGSKNQLPRIQSVVTLKYSDKKVYTIGYLGYMGVITGFNDSKVFAAILDSGTGEVYSSTGKRSYPLDIRAALESKKTLDEAAEYMKDPQKNYAYNHLIAFADAKETKILENNISGNGSDGNRIKRELRTSDSKLNKGIEWGFKDAIGSVNSFLLYGNYDNHTDNKNNTKRWKNMGEQLAKAGDTVSLEELEAIATYDGGSPGSFLDSGDLYNKMTLYTVIWEPKTLSMELYFHPRGVLEVPKDPTFEKVHVPQ